jgi:hypothetical protein
MQKKQLLLAGQPRNGTSMMMRVLSFGGIPIDYDKELDVPNRMEKFGNKHGFFEIKKNLPKREKTFKVIFHKTLEKYPNAKVIFIKRDLTSVIKSWQNVGDVMEINKLTDRVKKNRKLFEDEIKKHEHLIIDFDDMQTNPQKECEKIKQFVKDEFDFNVNEAKKAVDNELYHHKKHYN